MRSVDRPAARARASVVESTMAPAASVGPSMPSVPMLASDGAARRCASQVGRGEREFLIAAAPALAGRRGPSSRRSRRRTAGRGTLARRAPATARRCATPAIRASPTTGVVEPHDVVAERSRPRRPRRPSRRAAPPMTADVDSRRAADRPASASRASRRARRASQMRDDRRRIRAAAPPKRSQDVERVGERRLASATVGPDPMTLRSSPTTSEIASVRHAPRARGREPAAFDRGQMLAHGVQRVNVGAGAQQALVVAACRRA